MQNYKNLKIITGIGVVLILLGISYAVINSRTPEKIQQNDFSIPTEAKIELPSKVVVNNVYNNEGYTYDNGTKVFEKNDYYQITYSPTDDTFDIIILSDRFSEGRTLAENALLSELEISKEEACQLNVRITTHPQLNPVEAENEYGLSFCE
jgi:hypothetical protein